MARVRPRPAVAGVRADAASDADRDIVFRTLAEAYAEGRLDREEYDERADAVHGAKTLGELPGMLDDLVPTDDAGAALVRCAGHERVSRSSAIARWETEPRRDAFMAFLIPTLSAGWSGWSLVDPAASHGRCSR